ncbi:MAG TPA: EamA family transporter, partial [Blastocatellia bacterium]|nr:EamA family transporter [Blastocatellia bacterium]
MEIGGLSLTGLLFATGTSVTNVVTDVSRKKALDGCDLIAALACMKFFSAVGYAVVLGARLLAGNPIEIRDSGPVFGFESLAFSPPVTFLIYLLIDVSLVGIANVLYFRALQISPLSLCMPFIAFTPIFLIPTGWVLLNELPTKVKLIGVVLIVVGSLIMHRQLFAVSWAEPLKAIIRERGSRYMLMVAFIFSLTNPLDAKLVRMSHAFTHAFVFGLSFFIMFGAATVVRKSDWRR